jgi:hypothetical protein
MKEIKEIKEIKEPSLVGAMSLKGKKVKLKYIHPNSVARILIAEFDDIWVATPKSDRRRNLFKMNIYKWKVAQGVIYSDQLMAIPESEMAYSNMPIRFTIEFTLEKVEYEHEEFLVETEPIEVGIGACSAVNKAFSSYLPTDKLIIVNQWEGQGEWLWRLDGKKWG